MADTFPFELVSPERLVLSEEVEQVLVPGADGQMTVMKDHSPVMTTVAPGLVKVKKAGGGEEVIFVDGGFADVNANGLSLLAELAVPASELTSDALGARISEAEEAANGAEGDAKDMAALRAAQLNQVKADLSL